MFRFQRAWELVVDGQQLGTQKNLFFFNNLWQSEEDVWHTVFFFRFFFRYQCCKISCASFMKNGSSRVFWDLTGASRLFHACQLVTSGEDDRSGGLDWRILGGSKVGSLSSKKGGFPLGRHPHINGNLGYSWMVGSKFGRTSAETHCSPSF